MVVGNGRNCGVSRSEVVGFGCHDARNHGEMSFCSFVVKMGGDNREAPGRLTVAWPVFFMQSFVLVLK